MISARKGAWALSLAVMRASGQTPPLTRTPSGADELGRVAELFGVVADKTRAAVLYALSESEELTLPELASAVNASEHSVMVALRALRVARMIHSRRPHDVVLYSLRDRDVRSLLHMAAVTSREAPMAASRRRASTRLSARR